MTGDQNNQQEDVVEKRVTYTIKSDSKFFVVENVPARLNKETGEQFFSPKTVEHLHQIILDGRTPDRLIETPVYNYVAQDSVVHLDIAEPEKSHES